MLVLTRRNGQSIRIGPDIEVHVVRIEGDRVVLGFDAPCEVPIARGELHGEVGDEVRHAAADRDRIRALLNRA